MTEIQQIQQLVERLERLPRQGSSPDWAGVLDRAGLAPGPASTEVRRRRFRGRPLPGRAGLSPLATRRSRVRSRYAIAAATAAALAVAAGTALGAASRLVNLFEGTPAPPPVQQNFIRFDAQANAANAAEAQASLANRFPLVDANQAQGEIAISSAEGPVYLWAAPTSDGSSCWLVQFGDDQVNGMANGNSSCEPASAAPSAISWTDYWSAEHPTVRILDGHVNDGASTLQASFSDGSSATLQVVDGYFLDAFAPEATVTGLTAYDAQGNELAQTGPAGASQTTTGTTTVSTTTTSASATGAGTSATTTTTASDGASTGSGTTTPASTPGTTTEPAQTATDG